MTDTILKLENVTKRFGGLTAVNDVSFSVERNEFLGIAGPNGSGKSTLFNIISHIPFGATSGEITFDGKSISGVAPQEIASLGLARTFQKDVEFPDLSATETVAIAAHYGGAINGAEAKNKTDSVLDLVEFASERRNLPTTEISVYERKQLMIASALVMNPKILMLDEPASGLTKPEISSLETLLREINKRNVTVILIEHVLSLLMAVSERLIVLNQGSLIAQGKPDTVMKDPQVIEAYLGNRAA